jgi:nucleolar protein 4
MIINLRWRAVQVKERAVNAKPVVKQVKILREADKVGADGKAASKGWAFVELSEHDHALCALRQLNNNPVTFGEAFHLKL